MRALLGFSREVEMNYEINSSKEPISSRSSVATVVTVNVSRSFSTETVKKSQNVASEDQQYKTRHPKANIVSGMREARDNN